jgi:hypothetical protein
MLARAVADVDATLPGRQCKVQPPPAGWLQRLLQRGRNGKDDLAVIEAAGTSHGGPRGCSSDAIAARRSRSQRCPGSEV